jgi:hypothetical protein
MRFGAVLAAVVALGASIGATGLSSGGWHARGAPLRGDSNGDGSPESVVIEQRGRSCVFRLVAGSLTARVRPSTCEGKPSEVTLPGPDPHVEVLADLDGHSGLEIVLQLGHGAHTEFADLWAVRDGKLRRFVGSEPHVSYGGSVGTGSHFVDCARKPGVLLISHRGYRPPARVIRTWYRVRGLRLRKIRTRSIHWPLEKEVPFHEFGYPQPFPTCAKVRAPR